MISVAQALAALFDLTRMMPVDWVPLPQAAGRVLRQRVTTDLCQPPFDSSAMDGYAVADQEHDPARPLRVIGESAAGHPFEGTLTPGTAVRIFTGGVVPAGAVRVVIQEDVTREGDRIHIAVDADPGPYIRPAGSDFAPGFTLSAPRLLSPNDVALLAAMNIAQVPVSRRPVVALMSTGDELVMPGETPGAGQIIASNTFGLQAMIRAAGAEARILPIARDTEASLRLGFDLAQTADLVITIGGASVGDHDLVAGVAADLGVTRAFYKVAMRPGKPLMSGRMGDQMMIGLPGNPVSAMVCGTVFVQPVIRAMLGFAPAPMPRIQLPLTAPLPANGPREHYMRAHLAGGHTGGGCVSVFSRQDSSLLSVLGASDALVVRPPHDPARATGDLVDVIRLTGTDRI